MSAKHLQHPPIQLQNNCPSFLHSNFADSSGQNGSCSRRKKPTCVKRCRRCQQGVWHHLGISERMGFTFVIVCPYQKTTIRSNNKWWKFMEIPQIPSETPLVPQKKHKHNECRVLFPEWSFMAPSNWNPATSCWMVGLDWYPTWPARPCKHVKTHDDRWQLHLI